jgi:O-antigen/teichoic acid export membrane protein
MKSLLRSSSLRDQLLRVTSVAAATVANNLLAFAISVLAARELGPEGFGIFSLAFATATLIGILGDLGFNLSVIRLYNGYSGEEAKQVQVMASALGFKIFLWVITTLFALPFADMLTSFFGLDSRDRALFAVAFATAGLLILWTYLQTYLQAQRHFRELALFIWGYSGLRLLGLPLAYSFFPKNPLAWFVAIYTLPLILLLLVGLVPISVRTLSLIRTGMVINTLKEVLNYSKWVALSTTSYTSMPYVLRLILTKSASLEEVGVFSAGMTFTAVFSTLNTAVRAVLFPQVTALGGQGQMKRYLGRLVQIAPYYTGLSVVGIAFLGVLQWGLLGEEYRRALPVFFVTASALVIVVFLGWGTMLVHTMMRPQVDAGVNVARLVLVCLLALVMLPLQQSLGAAIAYAISLLVGEFWMLWYVKRKLRGGI